ncbi:MAG: methyltransferase [Dermatophilaceae bacterium]
MPEPDHYFSATPAGPASRRTVSVQLAGRAVEVRTSGGVFSPGRLDPGTAVLLREVPDPARHGALLDLGCGWGPIALTLAMASPEADVYAVDVNERARDLTRDNAESLGLQRISVMAPEQVPPNLRFAAIWSNPPIRVGKPALHALLRTWLPRLEPDGTAYLVVAKNLGADSLARWIDEEVAMPCRRLATSRGYRVLAVTPAP